MNRQPRSIGGRKWILLAVAGGSVVAFCLLCGTCAMCAPAPRAPTPEVRASASSGDAGQALKDSGVVLAAIDAGLEAVPSAEEQGETAKVIEVPLQSECPEGFWALIPGFNPGDDEFEARESERRREALAPRVEELRSTTFYSTVGAVLGEYDLRRQHFPVIIEGLGRCRVPEVGTIRIAYTQPRVVTEREIGENTRAAFQSREWAADEFTAHVPLAEREAEALREATRRLFAAGVRAEVIFRVKRGRLDRHVSRDPTGERVDIGAGPLVEVEQLGFRLLRGGELIYDSLASDDRADSPRAIRDRPCTSGCEAGKRRCADRCRRLRDSTPHDERMGCHRDCEAAWTDCVESCLTAE